jgi:peptidoglycan/xylan/chitin deacetylase (PgdA/CDA1 family)
VFGDIEKKDERGRATSRQGLPILCYHSIDNSGSPISIAPNQFVSHMNYLSQNSFRVLTVTEILRFRELHGHVPWNVIAITFDDGFENNFTQAYPIMKELGFRATVFLVTGYIGGKAAWMRRDFEPQQEREWTQDRPPLAAALGFPERRRERMIRSLSALAEQPMLHWEQIRRMRCDGFEFGAHTVSHLPLPNLEIERVRRESNESREAIETKLGERVPSFCYPYGLFDSEIEEGIANLGFESACTTRGGLNDLRHPELYRLNRIMLNDSISVGRLRLKVFRYRELAWWGQRLAKTMTDALRTPHRDSDSSQQHQGERA